ncbi:MAG TPA: acyl-CoA dehydrogenase family protein [Methylomirabilota bacterium]|jgi:acyl-CoA dehydrogenase|nr:acyl-CoA dehydrogenase family protein [Methylomirabilota bacterium]
MTTSTTMRTTDPTSDWAAVARELGPRFAARAAAHDAADAFVADNYKELRASRVFSAGVPAELGGGGAAHAELCDMLRVLAQHCGSTALALAMHTHQVAIPAWRWRHEGAPVEPFLRRVAAEELILATSGGSDWLAGSGRAGKVDGGYRVSARKVFSSGSPVADLFMTMAVYDDPQAGPTVLHFGIPFDAPGLKRQDNWRTLGMRGTGSNDVVLDGVFVPDTAIGVRRPAGRWSPVWHVVATLALPLIYAVYVGVAEAARGIAVRQAAARRQDASVQQLVGLMDTELATARMGLRHMVAGAASGHVSPETTNEVMIGRTVAGQAAIRTVEVAMEAAGGAGFFRDLGLERLFRDVQGARYHPLRADAQRLYAGRLALGQDLNG